MKKFFSLTEQKKITPGNGQKIIAAEDFSHLLESKEVVERAHHEAIAYRKEIVNECELLKQQSEKEGFEEGLFQFNAQLAQLEKELAHQKEEWQKNIISLATAAVRKIIGQELKSHPETIVDIVSTALKPVSQHKRATIYVNKGDLEIIEAARPRIKELFEHIEQLSIQARDDVAPGGCVIETEAGIINAQLEMQLLALERAFRQIVETKKRKP